MSKRGGTRVLSHERFSRARQPDATARELAAVREIAHALAHADRPDEVFQFALDRTTTLIGASFASVYLVEGVSELMRLVAASNWPEQHRPWLSEVRVRLGFGPSGESAAERRIIEVPDVLADGGLEDWAEVGRELGFRGLVALPLQDARSALGAVTFYFAEPGVPSAERRQMMRLVADQMAAAAVRSKLVADLRRTGAALSDAREEVERLLSTRPSERNDGGRLVDGLVAALTDPLSRAMDAVRAIRAGGEVGPDPLAELQRVLEHATGQLEDWQEIFAVGNGVTPLVLESLSPRELALASTALADEWVGGAGIAVKLVPGDTPTLATDRRKITRLLASLLVFAESRAPGSPVTLAISTDAGAGTVHFQVRDSGPDLGREQVDALFDPLTPAVVRGRHRSSVALARAMAGHLGGTLVAAAVPGQGLQLTCSLPITTSS